MRKNEGQEGGRGGRILARSSRMDEGGGREDGWMDG